MNEKIRAVIRSDIDGLKIVIDSSQLFPSEYLDEMIFDYFNNSETKEIWFTYIENNVPIAIGYCVPEKLTEGTYNLLAIGVLKATQRKGIANEMKSKVHEHKKQYKNYE